MQREGGAPAFLPVQARHKHAEKGVPRPSYLSRPVTNMVSGLKSSSKKHIGCADRT